MAFTKITGKTGVYRHTATQFVVHEVYNLEQLVASNGVFVEWADGAWKWAAGRDFRDLLSCFSCTTLESVCAALDNEFSDLGTKVFTDPLGQYPIYYPLIVDSGRIKGAPVAKTGPKIFALVNNLHAGSGRSLQGEEGQSKWGFKYVSEYVHTHGAAAQGSGSTTRANNTIDSVKTAAGPTLRTAPCRLAADATSLYGTGVVAIPLGMTWDAFVDLLISKLEHGDRSEVKTKCHEMMDPMVVKLKAAVPLPYMYVPVEITSTGVYVVLPHAARNMVLDAGAKNTLDHKRILAMPLRGGVYFDDYGLMHTSDVWLTPAKRFDSGLDWVHGPGDALSATGTGNLTTVATAASLEGVGTVRVKSIDGVKVERILGGIAGGMLSDTGEQTQTIGASYTAVQLSQLWNDTFVFSVDAAGMARGVVAGTGLPESDAVWQQRLESYSGPPEHANATQLTTWDTHGLSAGVGMMILLASLDGGKTDAAWLQILWASKQRGIPVWVANTYGGGPTKIAQSDAAPGTLL